MNAHLLPVPGVVFGTYPERRDGGPIGRRLSVPRRVNVLLPPYRECARYQRFVDQVRALDSGIGDLAPHVLREKLRATRACLGRHGFGDQHVADAFVLLKKICARELGMELFPTQLMAARIMLDGRLAEMATGEGKTVAAAISAATAAMAGVPVHVITANDYLVERDAAFLRPVYAALGLSVAAVTQRASPAERRRAYACNVVYSTASELAFDYLRDGLVRAGKRSDLQQRVATLDSKSSIAPTLLNGLCMALIDEADSVLIDDSRMPLILSEQRKNEAESVYLRSALDVAGRLSSGTDFELDLLHMSAELTESGRATVERLAEQMQGAWHNRLHREETVRLALTAVHLYRRDRDYLVDEGKVTIVDQSTGRRAPGRVWSRGLHQLVELKENCRTSGESVTLAQITYQRFFQRYLFLGGMSGTLREARAELLSIYGLRTVSVPLHRPDKRKLLPTLLYRDVHVQHHAVVSQASRVSGRGRPVLIGTDSVAQSEALSRWLTQANLPHAVLNARQHDVEAEVVRRAGERGRITVATNMAGRGTDIVLAAGVAELGGLHVICCQANRARRIDRQLIGRCARRGDPGSAQTILAMDQPLLARRIPAWFARLIPPSGLAWPQWLTLVIVSIPQWLEERRDRAARRALLSQDVTTARNGSFGTPAE